MSKIIHCAAIFTLVFFALSCKEIQGPAGPPGPGIESLTDPSIMPKIISTYPPANSEGPYDDYFNNQIQIRFNKIMDRTLMRRALRLTSPMTSVRIDTTNVYSIGGDLFIAYAIDSLSYYYYYGHRWKVGQTYTLTVDSTAKDINGNAFLPSYSMTFKPEPYFRVRRFYPQNGATDILPYADISMVFNSPVDTSIFSSIHLTPDVPGKWIFAYYGYDSTQIYYSRLGILNNNTTYTMTVNTTAHDKYGNYLSQQYMSSFTTSPFRVSGTYPQNGRTDVSLSTSISVAFTSRIDTGSVRSAFQITPATSGSFYLYDGNTSFEFYPSGGLLADTMYTVTIDTSVRSKDGTKLSSPYVFSFRTVPFTVTYTFPYNGQTGISRYPYSIEVGFSAPIDTGSVRSAFSIPGVSGYFSFYDGGNYFYYYPTNTPLLANTIYTATISTAMRSKGGARLKAPYTFSFTTGN